jgi:hypothetical protein
MVEPRYPPYFQTFRQSARRKLSEQRSTLSKLPNPDFKMTHYQYWPLSWSFVCPIAAVVVAFVVAAALAVVVLLLQLLLGTPRL